MTNSFSMVGELSSTFVFWILTSMAASFFSLSSIVSSPNEAEMLSGSIVHCGFEYICEADQSRPRYC